MREPNLIDISLVMEAACCICGSKVEKGKHVKSVTTESSEGKFLQKYFKTVIVTGLLSCQNCTRQLANLTSKLSLIEYNHRKAMTALNENGTAILQGSTIVVSQQCDATVTHCATSEISIKQHVNCGAGNIPVTVHALSLSPLPETQKVPVVERLMSPVTPASECSSVGKKCYQLMPHVNDRLHNVQNADTASMYMVIMRFYCHLRIDYTLIFCNREFANCPKSSVICYVVYFLFYGYNNNNNNSDNNILH